MKRQEKPMKKDSKSKAFELQLCFQGVKDFPELNLPKTMTYWVIRALKTDAVITVRFVGEEEGRELNRTYRGKDYATNILTFDYVHDPVEADLVICVPVVAREARDQNKSFKEHMAHILVHGVLHAHGYDHMNDEEAEVMEQEETRIITSLGYAPPYPDKNYETAPLLSRAAGMSAVGKVSVTNL
jgi:probable rRNA maturation factor